MTNKEGRIERQVNKITLKALREKVKCQCEVVRQSISEMETRLNEAPTVERDKYATINVKVSIR